MLWFGGLYKNDIGHEISVENWKSSKKPTGGFHKMSMVGSLNSMKSTEKSHVCSHNSFIHALCYRLAAHSCWSSIRCPIKCTVIDSEVQGCNDDIIEELHSFIQHIKKADIGEKVPGNELST
ncbi:protein kinase and PP2C-like domain-containing protein [Cinnamomum micranthum f. kanehirae]|uniref:Protein kinase and PP2C-like domain-containing protein n=1 Tax=Cinnamomum micranthum f. kanehirae TaxID=337451 RepID=A0A3S3NBQ2_9MAGN|nr:protein kinase and PP2C-like domain-containing protein [Cinnamomum micranthum f. kanehirae]